MGVNKVQYGSQVLLDISDATVTPAQLLKGAVAYNAAGEKIAGSLDPMLKSEYGGSGPGIVAMADKASEANSAQSANTAVNAQYAATADTAANASQSANTAVNAQYAATADTAANASKLGGRTLAQIVPKYTAAETAMPYVWLDGKTVYRQCLELAVSDFDQSTTEQFYPDYAGTITETSTTQLNSKTVVLNGAALILPTSCATSISNDGQNIRPLSNVRPGGQGYELGWRFDKSGTGWKISVDIGRFLPSQFSKFLFVIYYTK